MLNAGLTPVVPRYGSVGASGDLAPLAHCALALIGEGEVTGPDGETGPAAAALAQAGIEPVTLTAKEGLALINGTDGMLAMLALATHDLARVLSSADSAANLRHLLAGSAIVASHRHGDPRVQDAYSLRCAPQVVGAARDTLAFADGGGAKEP